MTPSLVRATLFFISPQSGEKEEYIMAMEKIFVVLHTELYGDKLNDGSVVRLKRQTQVLFIASSKEDAMEFALRKEQGVGIWLFPQELRGDHEIARWEGAELMEYETDHETLLVMEFAPGEQSTSIKYESFFV